MLEEGGGREECFGILVVWLGCFGECFGGGVKESKMVLVRVLREEEKE